MKYTATLLAVAFTVVFSCNATADVVINEWNAVSGSNTLDESDSFFGTVTGNGGNWLELVVVADGFGTFADLRGWQVAWGEDENDDGSYSAAEMGTLTFSNDAFWQNVQSGTLITIIETPDADGATDALGAAFDTGTDTSFDPNADDWHINISTIEEFASANPLIIADSGDNAASPDGEFSVGGDDWYGEILDENGNVVFGRVGENEAGWGGGGINSSETGRLEAPVDGSLAAWQSVGLGDYDDSDNSSFGSANTWSGGTVVQSFVGLRSVPEPGSIGLLVFASIGLFVRRKK